MTVSSILSGLLGSGLLVSAGETLEVAGVLLATTVENGGSALIASGGSASATTVQGGGADVVASGATVRSTIVQNGGRETVSGGTASATTVSSGGAQYLTAGGIASAATVDSAGIQYVSDGSAFATLLQSGAAQYVGTGGFASATVLSGAGAYAYVLGGGSASAITVSSGGIAYVNGGSAGATVVSSGGSIDIVAGGVASSTVLLAGAAASVSLTGIATATTIEAGASATVGASGTVSATMVSGSAAQLVVSGGAAFGTTVANGGTLVLLGGEAASTSLAAGGSALVSSGGTLSAATVGSGGFAVVSSGGITSAAVIAGGTLVLDTGAAVSGGVSFQSGSQGGDLVISGTAMPAAPIGGFATGDTIELASIPYDAGGGIGLSGATLSFTENGNDYSLTLTGASGGFSLGSAGSGSEILVACYAEGTAVATPAGAAPVERLLPGDLVLAWRDGAWVPRPVCWVGYTKVDLARHRRPDRAAPIRIRRGAIGPGVPARDLRVSPDHAIYLDGALFQAQALVNGATVVQEWPGTVTYWHVELDCHALLLAEGLSAETYLDTGNRALFAGERGGRALHPDLSTPSAAALHIWAARGCAPLRLAGDAVRAAQLRLLARAHDLGGALTADPGLRVFGDGREQALLRLAPLAWQALLPAGTRRVRLASRHFVPDWLARGEADRRRLGVAVDRLRLNGNRLGAAAFVAGWHAPEAAWRWTDGDAVLALPPLRQPGRLAVSAVPMGPCYWDGRWATPLAAAPGAARR